MSKYQLKPKTKNQSEYIRTIVENDITFCVGPSGTGKTAVSVGLAVQYFLEKKVNGIVITRPTIKVEEWSDDSIGSLPGTLREKIHPYLMPILDELYKYMFPSEVEKLILKNVIEICPLQFIRGRTFNETFMLMDEGQNATYNQIKAFITRLGQNSKVVINGDLTQFDIRKSVSPLQDWIDILQDVKRIGFSYMDETDIVRNKLIRAILQKAEEFEKRREL